MNVWILSAQQTIWMYEHRRNFLRIPVTKASSRLLLGWNSERIYSSNKHSSVEAGAQQGFPLQANGSCSTESERAKMRKRNLPRFRETWCQLVNLPFPPWILPNDKSLKITNQRVINQLRGTYDLGGYRGTWAPPASSSTTWRSGTGVNHDRCFKWRDMGRVAPFFCRKFSWVNWGLFHPYNQWSYGPLQTHWSPLGHYMFRLQGSQTQPFATLTG